MLHLEELRAATRRPFSVLQEEANSVSANHVGRGKSFAYVSDVYNEDVRILGMNIRVGRVFVRSSDTGFYRKIGWMLNNDVHYCMVCLHRFGFLFDPKEHCHACGSIVCGSCIDKATIVELRGCGIVPVGKCCFWGLEQVSIVETKPPHTRAIYENTHERYSAAISKSFSASVSEPESLFNERFESPDKPMVQAQASSNTGTSMRKQVCMREDRTNKQMMNLLRESADFSHTCGGGGVGAGLRAETESLPSLRVSDSPRYYNKSFAPCRSHIFDIFIESGGMKSQSLDEPGFPHRSAKRGQRDGFYLRKAYSADEYTPSRFAKFPGGSAKASASSKGLFASRIYSEEADCGDFALGGRHLHQAFRFDRDSSAAGGVVGYATSSVQGQALLTSDCMEFRQELCVHSAEARALKEAACQNTRVLLGWQVLILRQDHTLLGLGVVTAVHKSLQRQSFYRISTDTGTDCWLRLKRRARQSGTDFQPLRKVLYTFGDVREGKNMGADGTGESNI